MTPLAAGNSQNDCRGSPSSEPSGQLLLLIGDRQTGTNTGVRYEEVGLSDQRVRLYQPGLGGPNAERRQAAFGQLGESYTGDHGNSGQSNS